MVVVLFSVLIPVHSAFALLNLELTQGVSGAVPIAVVPFAEVGIPPQHVAEIVNNDLQHSGRFRAYNQRALAMHPSQLDQVSFSYFQKLGTDNIVIGHVQALGGDRYQVSFQLLDAFKARATTDRQHQGQNLAQNKQAVVLSQQFVVSATQLRQVAHHISDLIYEKILGVRGVFSTRLAYVVVKCSPAGPARYTLEVADEDGYNPRLLLSSNDPIMSPSWAPNSKQIAYVSFENRRAAIYIQDVASGKRRLVSQLPGINGAPAWSPDGRKLALVLSKGEAPNIYVLDIGSRQLKAITHDYYINTEPAWSPDGRMLIFTSTRSGGPQIYQYNFQTQAVSRLTYDGNYNARGGITADGQRLVTIHKDGDAFSIALFDLNTGAMRMLTPAGTHDSSSPSVAPNGSMVLYDTVYQGRNMLAMVSTDGRVQLRLPARDGEAQDPAWSPFTS